MDLRYRDTLIDWFVRTRAIDRVIGYAKNLKPRASATLFLYMIEKVADAFKRNKRDIEFLEAIAYWINHEIKTEKGIRDAVKEVSSGSKD